MLPGTRAFRRGEKRLCEIVKKKSLPALINLTLADYEIRISILLRQSRDKPRNRGLFIPITEIIE
jgi:hypothetical protein